MKNGWQDGLFLPSFTGDVYILFSLSSVPNQYMLCCWLYVVRIQVSRGSCKHRLLWILQI